MLAERGCRVTVLPAEWGAEELLKMQVDGLFISNGPGDPAAIRRVARAIRQVAEQGMPVFGICLGHQLIARAFGGSTFKLPFGHHGANHPVMNHDRHTVEITSQNHGFAVRGDGQNGVEGAPALRITHLNLYDRTVAGIAHRTLPVMAVQYPPRGGARSPRQRLPLRPLRRSHAGISLGDAQRAPVGPSPHPPSEQNPGMTAMQFDSLSSSGLLLTAGFPAITMQGCTMEENDS